MITGMGYATTCFLPSRLVSPQLRCTCTFIEGKPQVQNTRDRVCALPPRSQSRCGALRCMQFRKRPKLVFFCELLLETVSQRYIYQVSRRSCFEFDSTHCCFSAIRKRCSVRFDMCHPYIPSNRWSDSYPSPTAIPDSWTLELGRV